MESKGRIYNLTGLILIFSSFISFGVMYVINLVLGDNFVVTIIVVTVELIALGLLIAGMFMLRSNGPRFKRAPIFLISSIISVILLAVFYIRMIEASLTPDDGSIYSYIVREQYTGYLIGTIIVGLLTVYLTFSYMRQLLYGCAEIALAKGDYWLHRKCKNAWMIWSIGTALLTVLVILVLRYMMSHIYNDFTMLMIIMTIAAIIIYVASELPVYLAIFKVYRKFHRTEVVEPKPLIPAKQSDETDEMTSVQDRTVTQEENSEN